MRLVNRASFLAMPEGTIYAKGREWVFGSLCIKDENRGDKDWWYLDPAGIEPPDSSSKEWLSVLIPCYEEMRDNGASFPMADTLDNDGLYDADALFLIFEKDDLLRLRGMIDTAIALEEEDCVPSSDVTFEEHPGGVVVASDGRVFMRRDGK